MVRRTLLFVLLVLTLAACGSAATRAAVDEDVEIWCEGAPVLVVRNNATYAVEIWESGTLESGRVIATLPPGKHELTIRPEADYQYSARREGGGSTATSLTGSADFGPVQLTKECR